MPAKYGVQVRPSTIKGAGFGLFATRAFKGHAYRDADDGMKLSNIKRWGDTAVPYSAILGHTPVRALNRADFPDTQTYKTEMDKLNQQQKPEYTYQSEVRNNRGVWLNSWEWNNTPGRFANDRGKGGENIAPYPAVLVGPEAQVSVGRGDLEGRLYVWMYATRNIKKGEELFFYYGHKYWEDEKKSVANSSSSAMPPSASAPDDDDDL